MEIEFGQSFSVPNLQLSKAAKELVMLWVPPGTFMMGSPSDEPGHGYEDGLPFLATLSKGFWLGQYEVTQAQWQAVMGNNPSHFQSSDFNCPIETVSWHDALAFCDQLNQRLDNGLPVGYQFSLPTQMQWEYACRAGTTTVYYRGSSIDDLVQIAWCAENSGGHTHPVGEKGPNTWKLYDTLGNVGEWCYDAAEDYPKGPTIDWMGQKYASVRAIRGGWWRLPCGPDSFGSARCVFINANEKRSEVGFRLCLRWHDFS